MFYERTTPEDLHIVSAYLSTAEESFVQAAAHLATIQPHQLTQDPLLIKFQATFKNLQLQFSTLEQQFQTLILPVDQTDQPGP
jgi:hypothetical protein